MPRDTKMGFMEQNHSRVRTAQNRTPHTERTRKEQQNRIGQKNRLGQDRSQSPDRTKSDRTTESTAITRRECTTAHTQHDYTKSLSRGGADLGTKRPRGRARTTCRLSQRGDVHEHHATCTDDADPAPAMSSKEMGQSEWRLAGRHAHLPYLRQWTRHRNITFSHAGFASPDVADVATPACTTTTAVAAALRHPESASSETCHGLILHPVPLGEVTEQAHKRKARTLWVLAAPGHRVVAAPSRVAAGGFFYI